MPGSGLVWRNASFFVKGPLNHSCGFHRQHWDLPSLNTSPRITRRAPYGLPADRKICQFYDGGMQINDGTQANDFSISGPVCCATQKLPIPFGIMAYEEDWM